MRHCSPVRVESCPSAVVVALQLPDSLLHPAIHSKRFVGGHCPFLAADRVTWIFAHSSFILRMEVHRLGCGTWTLLFHLLWNPAKHLRNKLYIGSEHVASWSGGQQSSSNTVIVR